jgi:hypothetical protein
LARRLLQATAPGVLEVAVSPLAKSTYVCITLALATPSCATEIDGMEEDVLVGDPDAPIDAKTDMSGWKVEDAIRRVCSTAAVAGLAEQLVDELSCMQPGVVARIDGLAGVSLTPATRPYLQSSAARALSAAGRTRSISLTSGLRTLPQQFLLHQWYTRGLCKNVVTLAARPGRSNHESGLAIDVSNYSAAKNALRSQGFTWSGSRDPVHFDYRDGSDLRSLSVRAFQRLHNLNATSKIAVDGAYGPQTEGALKRAPAAGFRVGSTCEATGRLLVDVDWTPLGDDHVALHATVPDGAVELELWIGGEQVAVLEAGRPGEVVTAVAAVFSEGPQLLEAVALDAAGEVLGRGLDYLEVEGVGELVGLVEAAD